MKKLIAIAVVFGLLATAAFADVSIGGSAGFGARIIQGDSSEKGDDDAVINTVLGAHWGTAQFVWSNDENTAGAKVKLNGNTNKGVEGTANSRLGAGIWWKPLEILKVEFTDLEDEGVFGRGNAIDWGYQANSSAGNVTSLWGGGWNSFSNATLRTGHGYFGGIGGGGERVLALSLYPVDGLSVNFAWDVQGSDGVGSRDGEWYTSQYVDLTTGEIKTNSSEPGLENTADFFKKTIAQVTYTINGIGNFAVSFKANDESFSRLNSYAGRTTTQTIGIDFTTWAVSGMNIGIGALLPLAGKYEHQWWMDAEDVSVPIEIGLEYTLNQWSGEAFQLFARAGVQLPSEDYNNITNIGLDINPSYDLGIFRVFFDLGIALAMQKDNDDTDFFWHFNPYIRKGIGIGDFYAGINLWNGTERGGYESTANGLLGPDSTKIINFAVPIYFEVSF